MHLLITGPPGAGKGTQAAHLSSRYDIPAISTGDMFRAMRTSVTPLAVQVREIMASGGYVGDEITNAMVAERLDESDCRVGFLLDGYPRTVEQVDALDTSLDGRGKALDAVIALRAGVDEVVERLLRRAATGGRADDEEDAVRTRQEIFVQQTAPVLKIYQQRGLLVEVDGLGSVAEVSARIQRSLDERLGSRLSKAGA